MSRRNRSLKDTLLLPEQKEIVRLLEKYGDALFQPCPTSEQLGLYCEDQAGLEARDIQSIESHLSVCLDCRDKVEWLSAPERRADPSPGTITAYAFPVQIPPDDQINDPSMAYAAGSHPAENPWIAPVPCISDKDGNIYAEIGLDLDACLFLRFERLSTVYRSHAVQIRAFAKNGRVIETEYTALHTLKIKLLHPSDIKPEDLTRIELRFLPLRPE